MIKISALNDAYEEESGSEEEVTKEALEQIALQQYAKVLDLQRRGKLREATQLLKDLLDTELLYNIQKPAQVEKAIGPLFNLKYLCYKNLAATLSSSGEINAAIEAYCAASELDDTDVTLWHKLGQLCMQAKRYEMALHAFQSGAEINPRYWPCLDKIVKLLLGLDYKEECISTIHETLQLDPGYLRGLAYRQHIYKEYPYIKDYMEYLNPIYKLNKDEEEILDIEKAEVLIKEAKDINEIYLEQQRSEKFKHTLPNLKLKKPISDLTWRAVGDSLVHMHHFMTENSFSHACFIEIIFQKEEKAEPKSDIIEEIKDDQIESKTEENTEAEKNVENVSENENNDLSDKEKATTDTEKFESDIEVIAIECASNAISENKQKKTPVRRRGSALSFLRQWEWCNKRRSTRKKPVDDNIYDTLRKMIPTFLSSDTEEKKQTSPRGTSPDISDLNKLFEENDPKDKIETEEYFNYFGTDIENKDVKEFITKYIENKKDIIDTLSDYLIILAEKWQMKWPEGLSNIFIEANKCFNNHYDIPTCTDINYSRIQHYTKVNSLVEEFLINKQLNSDEETKEEHDINVIESIGMMLTMKPNLFSGTECLEYILRNLWAKFHIHKLHRCEDLALECLYQLLYEFKAMGEHRDGYCLNLINFTFKPTINDYEIMTSIKFLEQNKELSTVKDLYDHGSYEEVLSIVIDSFEHCKTIARNQEDNMSLDFAVQLCLILDTYWALDKVNECFKWSLICLHEALKNYFRYTTNSPAYDKWSLTVVKILCCMEHILSTEGLSCLDNVPQINLSQGLEDLIRIIGHQIETNATDMPFGTVIPWIIMHYILQREEDQGRSRPLDKDKVACDEIPNPLLVLFIGHEQLGSRGWCNKSDGKLLYFILDTVVPRLRSPSLAKCLDQIIQYMEQCVYCLFGHPERKNKIKYLMDHNVDSHTLDWKRAQQLYEIFKPPILPALEGKVPSISFDTEQLFHRILSLLPPECDPQKYVSEIDKYIKGSIDKLPGIIPPLPYKMKDIYFLLGDYYFKKEEGKMSVKYNKIDVVVNNDRLESWAQISLAKAVNIERLLNSCKNLNNEKEFLNPAKSIIICYKRSLELDPTHSNLRIEYGMFAYTVHSFCSRLLKQASESLSMEDFESLEKQKEDMLDTTQKCFTRIINDLNSSTDSEKEEESWLYFYMLGKVAEKRNKAPSIYLDYYLKGVKCLEEINATYPSKISYNSPTHLCIEVLELHYRIHASILKYIEQHENKQIPASVGRVFINCIEEWKKGPFSKNPKKENAPESETDVKPKEIVQPGNILKRSISDSGEDDNHEIKRLKLEAAAAKVRRSASYDTERSSKQMPLNTELVTTTKVPIPIEDNKPEPLPSCDDKIVKGEKIVEVNEDVEISENTAKNVKEDIENEKKAESSSENSSSSSSESSSSESSSDSSSDASRESDASTMSSNDSKPLADEDLNKIISACLDALEDCACRFPQHYKAIYRLAHYHFYCKKGKDIERCRDLMLSNFTSRLGPKLGGLFSERKHSNFFNNVWKIPLAEVDRAGGFAFHMSRSVQLTMEILKEIDDHKTLLDLSLHLQRLPEPDKKYLRDADREELAQQAFSLCIQSLRGQLVKFSQQADLKSNDVERQALKSLMLDIYRAYQRAQKHSHNSKQFTNLLIEAYKLVTTEPITENINYVDLSMKYCQKMISKLKHEATIASLDKTQNAMKKQVAKIAESAKTTQQIATPVVTTKQDYKAPHATTSASGLPKMSQHEMAVAFQNYLPMLNESILTQQTAAALSYLSKMSAFAGYSSLPNHLQSTLQNNLQNSFQAEFYRQYLEKSFSPYIPPAKKQKRGPKPQLPALRPHSNPPAKLTHSKSYSGSLPPSTKATPTSVITSLQKSNSNPLTPSMSTVLPNLPASITANLTSVSTHSSTSSRSTVPTQAHVSVSSVKSVIQKLPQPHLQVSPVKTLQEKLAEKQKHIPVSKSMQDLNSSISKLPSSLTITKTAVPKPQKKPEAKKSLPFNSERPKLITSDEIIILDDD